MENNTPKVPSIKELQEVHKANDYKNTPNIVLLKEVIRILKALPKFHKYLVEKDFDDYELAYSLFAQIIRYLKYCHQKNDTENIKKILEYIDGMTKTENDDVGDLLWVGVLEVFDLHKEILPDILPLMPDNLRQIFLKHYSDYLK